MTNTLQLFTGGVDVYWDFEEMLINVSLPYLSLQSNLSIIR